MSIFGIGPLLVFITVLYSIFVNLISDRFIGFRVDFLHDTFIFLIAAFLIIIGLIFFIISVITLLKGFPTGQLMKKGIYAYSRNPLYSSFICFLVPGIVLLSKNLLFFSIPFFMYVVFSLLIKKEEKYLEKTFGKEYIEYKASVGLLLPKIRRKFNNQ